MDVNAAALARFEQEVHDHPDDRDPFRFGGRDPTPARVRSRFARADPHDPLIQSELSAVWERLRAGRRAAREDRSAGPGEYARAWRDRAKFASWALRNGYRDGYRVQRIDLRRGYGPNNCAISVPGAVMVATAHAKARVWVVGDEVFDSLRAAEAKLGRAQQVIRLWCAGRKAAPAAVARTGRWRRAVSASPPREGCFSVPVYPEGGGKLVTAADVRADLDWYRVLYG